MFGPGINDGRIVNKEPDIEIGEIKMSRKPKKFYTVKMTFDEWVEINSEIHSKIIFMGGPKKISKAERNLLKHTHQIMFGEGLEDAKKN